MSTACNNSDRKFDFVQFPSVGPQGPKRLLVSLLLSMAVCWPAIASGPSIFPGETIAVRLNGSIDTGRNRTGEAFGAVVDRDVVSNGVVVIPKGTAVEGTLKEVISSGRLKRRAELTLEIDSVEIAGQRHTLEAEPEVRLGPKHAAHDEKFIGGGAVLGLVVGALAGGGKGAAIGSMSGAAAGAGGATITGKDELRVPSETVVVFRLKSRFSPELP